MGQSATPYDPRDVLAYMRQIRKENPTVPLSAIDDYVKAQTGGAYQSFAQLQRSETTDLRAGGRQAVAGAANSFAAEGTYTPLQGLPAGSTPADQRAAMNRENDQNRQAMGRSVLRGVTVNLDRPVANLLGLGQSGMYAPDAQANFRAWQAENPGTDMMLNIAGGIPTGGLLGSAAKKATAALATRMAANAVTAGKNLSPLGNVVQGLANGQGLVPATLTGAGVGGAYGGVSAAADGKSAGDIALSAGGGAVAGALGPLLIGGAKVAYRNLTPDPYARVSIRKTVEQIGNRGVGPGTGTAGDPITFTQRVGDAFNPARVRDRTEAGLRQMDLRAAALQASGRGASMTPMDADPSINNVLLTQGQNAVRQNPQAAGLAGVEALATRDAQAPARLAEDMRATRQVAGMAPATPRDFPAEQLGRPEQLATRLETQLGTAPAVPSPAARIGQVPTTAGYSAAKRVAEIEDGTRQWAASPSGYGGLHEVAQPIQGGAGVSPEMLDRIRYNLANAERANPDAPFRQVQSMLSMVQGGAQENAPVTLGRMQETLTDVNDLLRRARLPRANPQRINLDGPEFDALTEAKQVLTDYGDKGFSRNGLSFSKVQEQYARRMQARDAVVQGAEWYTTKSDPTDVAQQFAKLAAPEQTNAKVGIVSAYLNELRSAGVDEAGPLTTALLNKAGGAYQKNEVLKLAFPSPREFQQFAMKQVLYDAADKGYGAFTNTSPAMVQAMYDRLGTPAAKQEFARALEGGMADMLQNPKQVQDFVARAGEDLRSANGEWARKFQIVYGKKGAEEMRQRLLLEAQGQAVEQGMTAAARGTAAPERGPGGALLAGNPVSNKAVVAGPIRRALSTGSRQATKTAITKLLSAQGPEGMQAFREAILRASDPVQVGSFFGSAIPAIGGRTIGSWPREPQ